VDQVLEAMPGVKFARCVGVPDGAQVRAEDIRAFARDRLASYKVPRRIVFFAESELQLTGSAKVRPAELRARALQKLASDEQESPTS
jgi:fatty-acyl-CoA synthase